MNYFDSDMSNSTNTVVYLIGRLSFIFTFADNVAHNLYCQIRGDDNLSTCTFTTGKSIILCLHVLIARRVLLISDIMIIFSEYGCIKR
jgi:hypothetical protein